MLASDLSQQPESAAAQPKNPLVCIIYAYPSASSGHGASILKSVMQAASECSASVELFDLYRMNFNPIASEAEALHFGSIQPDIAAIQSKLSSAQSWIFIHPVWWSMPPAILKGFFDRIFTQGFAFDYKDGEIKPLLEGKRALVIRTFSASASHEQRFGMLSQKFMEKAVLGLCGIKAVSIDIYSIDNLAESAFAHTLLQISGAVRRLLLLPKEVPHHLRSISAPYLPPLAQKGLGEKESKVELSKQAEADLQYFKEARKHAREAVHRRADMRSKRQFDGKQQKMHAKKWQNQTSQARTGIDRFSGYRTNKGKRRKH